MKTFILLILAMTSGCSFENSRHDGKTKIPVFEIICKHPKKGFVSHFVKDSYTNIRPYNLRNSVWFFKDVKGVLVESSLGCYTDSTMKGYLRQSQKVEKKL